MIDSLKLGTMPSYAQPVTKDDIAKIKRINMCEYCKIEYMHPKGRFVIIKTSQGVPYNFNGKHAIQYAAEHIKNIRGGKML